MLAWVTGEGAGRYLTSAICEGTGGRKHGGDTCCLIFRLPVWAGLGCLQILQKVVFMRSLKAHGLPAPETGLKTGGGVGGWGGCGASCHVEAQVQGAERDERRAGEPHRHSQSGASKMLASEQYGKRTGSPAGRSHPGVLSSQR